MTHPNKKPSAANRPAILYQSTGKAMCDGALDALGHPRIYLDLPPNEKIACPYCGQIFYFKKDVSSSV